jgi:tetrahydromethanopterin S-methyltransferase subunit F
LSCCTSRVDHKLTKAIRNPTTPRAKTNVEDVEDQNKWLY